MREPVKRLKLYKEMKSDIASGVYLSGTFLPNEFDLADKYGYSRDTVRSVLTMLEDDKLVELLKGKGRQICPVPQDKIRQPISFLLPCTDFMSESSSDIAAEVASRMLKGVSEVAFEYDRMVQMVPVSPTNNAHDINWSKLNFVNKDSQLVINGYWYRDLFPMLSERGCRVAFVETQTCDFDIYADYLKDWFLLRLDRRSAAEAAVKLLLKKGYRRIALVHKDIAEKDHPVMQGYKDGMAKCGHRYDAWLDFDTENTSATIVAATIADFYKKNNFDAMLIEPLLAFRMRRMHLFNKSIGLPANIKIITVGSVSYNQTALQPISSTEFPYEEIGRIAAMRLLEDNFRGGQQIFTARTVEREAIVHEPEHLELSVI